MAAAVGGTAASISGGKFANGAITGAYVVLFNHWRHQKPGQLNLDEATPNEVLKHMMKVGRWAGANKNGIANIDEFFRFDGDEGWYSGMGDFGNFQNVEYRFMVAKGGQLNFSNVNVFVSDIFAIQDVVIVNGIDGTVIQNTQNINFSFQPYFNVIYGSGGVQFTWETANYYTGNNLHLVRSTIQGTRLAGYLTYQFTGSYRKETEEIPYK